MLNKTLLEQRLMKTKEKQYGVLNNKNGVLKCKQISWSYGRVEILSFGPE